MGARRPGPAAYSENARRDKDLALAVVKSPVANVSVTPMEAEQLNLIAHTLADLESRTAEMRRFL